VHGGLGFEPALPPPTATLPPHPHPHPRPPCVTRQTVGLHFPAGVARLLMPTEPDAEQTEERAPGPGIGERWRLLRRPTAICRGWPGGSGFWEPRGAETTSVWEVSVPAGRGIRARRLRSGVGVGVTWEVWSIWGHLGSQTV
jgi:hypothetical protein